MDRWLAGLKGTCNLLDAHRVKVYNKEFRAEHPEYFDPDGIMVFLRPSSLTFPGFGMEIDGVSYDVWADTKYNLSDIDDKFGGLMSVVRFATALLVYLALIRYLVNTYHRIFGGGE